MSKEVFYGLGGLVLGVLITVFIAQIAVNSSIMGMMGMMGDETDIESLRNASTPPDGCHDGPDA